MNSPFVLHRNKVLGHYSTASWLRMLVLAMYRGSQYQVGLSKLATVDIDHFTAALEMLQYYREEGEQAQGFMELANECRIRLEVEQEDSLREQKLESWLRDVRWELKKIGMPADLVDDCYTWFEKQFDAGTDAGAAAQNAKIENLSPA